MRLGKRSPSTAALLGAVLFATAASAGDLLLDRGSTFGMFGFSTRMSSGTVFDERPELEKEFRTVDPFFRAGHGLLPGLALGAELRMLHTFRLKTSTHLENVPSFSFGPAVMFAPTQWRNIAFPYIAATAGMSYNVIPEAHSPTRNGWNLGAAAGVVVMPGFGVGLGLEASWHYDMVRWVDWDEEEHKTIRPWLEGNTISFGFRVCGVKP